MRVDVSVHSNVDVLVEGTIKRHHLRRIPTGAERL
jgi:hypothetical protein